MDGTIVNTIKAYCDLYSYLYYRHPNFKPANPEKVACYNFTDQCPLVEDVESMFNHPYFFKRLNFINENTYEVLNKLNNKYHLVVVTIGQPPNLFQKAVWLEKKLPFIKEYVLITNEGSKMNKEVVNMAGAIQIDDIPSNLNSTNAETKILFGKKYPWNNEWQGEHCLTWTNIEKRLL